jgi:hypothetical protein
MKPTIPYVENFLTQKYADDLFAFIQTLPHHRERNKRNKTSLLRRVSYPGYCNEGSHRPAAGYKTQPLITMPEEFNPLRAALTTFAGRDVNYFSCIAYENELDHINMHQHKEDHKREATGDAEVLVISLGEIRELTLRPLGCRDESKYEHIYPAHGSLYVLPNDFNRTHEHGILDSKLPCGLRISINCKHIPVPTGPQVRWGNKEEFPDAVYVGKANSRGKFDYPASPFGNVKKLKPGQYREYVLDLVKEPCYAQELEKLRGRDLLCPWCKSNEKDCHARVLLELANA